MDEGAMGEREGAVGKHICGNVAHSHGRAHSAGHCEMMCLRTLGHRLSLLTTLTMNPYLTPYLEINPK